jgi:hypothetical protein
LASSGVCRRWVFALHPPLSARHFSKRCFGHVRSVVFKYCEGQLLECTTRMLKRHRTRQMRQSITRRVAKEQTRSTEAKGALQNTQLKLSLSHSLNLSASEQHNQYSERPMLPWRSVSFQPESVFHHPAVRERRIRAQR